MNGNRLVIRCPEGEELDRLGELAAQAFNFSSERWQSFPDLVGRENLRVAYADDEMVGGMSFYDLGQWFGGKPVPMAGFALVLMSPEQRGRGYAFEMLETQMRSLRERFPIATLFASTQYLYRKLGFEQAGNNYRYACSIRDIEGVRLSRAVRRIDPIKDRETIERIATTFAAVNNGNLQRNEGIYRRMFGEPGSFTYVFGEHGSETGYLAYSQTRQNGRTSPGDLVFDQRAILVRDMVALDAETTESIWAFIAGNRSVIEMVHWPGPANDIRCLATAEHEPKVVRPQRWMMRVLNVREALLQRGYPKVDADLGLEIEDTMFSENNGSIRLSIRAGQPSLSTDVSGSVLKVTINDLAPLFTGLWTASQLQIAGRLDCPDPTVIETADRVFAGSEPWMPDAF